MRTVLTVDPGADSGVALVCDDPVERQALGRLLGSWRVYGRRYRVWLHRANAAVEEALECCEDVGVTIDDFAIEVPPSTAKRSSLKGDRRGMKSWLGLGQRIGAWQAVGHRYGLDARMVPVGVWTAALGPVGVRSKKVEGGKHRILEALRLVPGVPMIERVDVAEAALLGLAVARRIA
ncbi:MAG: hypothetical protein AAFV53_21065 [Myxococcota bacterium]